MASQNKRIYFSIIIITLSFLRISAKVTEVPFIELPTGQVLIQVDFKGKIGQQYFIIETAGNNLIRRDMPERLDFIGIDTTKSFIDFPEISVGDMTFTKSNNFRLKRSLSNRSEYAFPVSVLGTLGSKFFKNKILQFNFQKNTLRIGDNVDEFEIKPQTPQVHFTQSFTNNIPVIDTYSTEFSSYNVYIDISLAIEICLPWKDIPASKRNQSGNSSEVYEMSLDGKKKIVFSSNNVNKLYLNREITLYNIEIMFSDDLTPSIGNLFLRNFISTIDFNDGILYLDPVTNKGITMIQETNATK